MSAAEKSHMLLCEGANENVLLSSACVHRYARTGNCNMGEFKDENGTVDWLTPMLEDVRF